MRAGVKTERRDFGVNVFSFLSSTKLHFQISRKPHLSKEKREKPVFDLFRRVKIDTLRGLTDVACELVAGCLFI